MNNEFFKLRNLGIEVMREDYPKPLLIREVRSYLLNLNERLRLPKGNELYFFHKFLYQSSIGNFVPYGDYLSDDIGNIHYYRFFATDCFSYAAGKKKKYQIRFVRDL